MRIVIDLQCLQNGSRHRGIGRYMLNLARNMIRQADADEIRLVLNASFGDTIEAIRDNFDDLLPQDKISVFEPLHPAQFHEVVNDARRIVSEYLRENFLLSMQPDVVLIGSVVEGFGDEVISSIGRLYPRIPTAAILYDLIPFIYPEQYLADERVSAWYMEKIDHLKQADLLLSISESSRNEGIEHDLQPPERIVNISTAVDIAFARTEATIAKELRSKFSIDKEYLLYTGASDPRKNLPRLIEAFARLPKAIRASHQLVLGGGMPAEHMEALRKTACSHGLNPESVVFTGHISDSDLVGLYANAKAFVFPSYHEGFGLPVLEAMQFGIPCVASNRASVPEVVGLQDALFDPFSIESMCHALNKVLVDETFRRDFQSHCPAQVAKFSWESSAARALKALRSRFGSAGGKLPSQTGVDIESTAVQTLCQRIADVRARGFLELWGSEGMERLAVAIDRTLPRGRPARQLFVDVSALHHHGLNTGIQRVVRNVLKELPTVVGPEWSVIPVYSTQQEEYRISEKVAKSVMGCSVNEGNSYIDPKAGDIFLGLDLSDVDVALHADYLQRLRRLGVGVYFVVYDLLPFLLPDCFPSEVCENYLKWLRIASQSDGLVSISRAVADELLAAQPYVGSPRRRPLKIGWFHLGADFQRTTATPGVLRSVITNLGKKPFFLVVATIEPRKAHAQVLEACERLWSEGLDFQLVFAGKKGWMVETLVEKLRQLQKREPCFLWFEDLTDAELEYTYCHASGLIAASLGEGYGLPVVEAFHYGCPVIARDIPVFREIAGQSATYFSGTSCDSLAASIKHLCIERPPNGDKQNRPAGVIDWKQSTKQLWDNVGWNRWYASWTPTDRWEQPLLLNLPSTDPRFGTQIGEKSSELDQPPLIISRGDQAGFLLHGPYVDLPPGRFAVSASGALESNGNFPKETYFDIVTNGGATTLAKGPLSQEKPGQLFSAIFETQETCPDVEVRIHLGLRVKASVKRVCIRQLSGAH